MVTGVVPWTWVSQSLWRLVHRCGDDMPTGFLILVGNRVRPQEPTWVTGRVSASRSEVLVVWGTRRAEGKSRQ